MDKDKHMEIAVRLLAAIVLSSEKPLKDFRRELGKRAKAINIPLDDINDLMVTHVLPRVLEDMLGVKEVSIKVGP